jgi:S-adenosylmethionine:tRNA ribosyltransferase-isomerase
MDVALFDYELPPERIAQEAVEPRDAARLLALDRAGGPLVHRRVADLPELLSPGDLLVVNDTRVAPARLFARRATGGRVELLLLEPAGRDGAGECWRALVGASRAPRRGEPLALPGSYTAELLDEPGAGAEAGAARVRIAGPGTVAELAAAHGRLPLPPYIRRAPDDPRTTRDRERYQTVYAAEEGALAAPTAGLHFTPGLLARLEEAGIARTAVTLHVGEGTFRPVRARRTGEIVLHPERFTLPAAASDAIAAARARGGRVVAVGTTVVRTLESRPARADGAPEPGAGETTLFVAPGHAFRFVDALVTNFHLPRSTLLMLVAAFAGRERVLAAYREAIAAGYRFYSYGDAMLVR